ncbi:glutamine-dependent NA [Sesbania bispinosa]|nr:glutamine-dependent NA [Sesbania bispinosa]
MKVHNPSLNLQIYSAEDNRFDLHQPLYNARWPYQFRKIDEFEREWILKVFKNQETILVAASNGDSGMRFVATGSSNPNVGF